MSYRAPDERRVPQDERRVPKEEKSVPQLKQEAAIKRYLFLRAKADYEFTIEECNNQNPFAPPFLGPNKEAYEKAWHEYQQALRAYKEALPLAAPQQ